jgi:hypothetical protein
MVLRSPFQKRVNSISLDITQIDSSNLQLYSHFMPKVTVITQSAQEAGSVFQKVCKMLDEDQDLRRLDPALKCEFNQDALTGTATGNQFKAIMSVTSLDSGSEVEIVVELPLHLGLVKGMIEKTLSKKLAHHLS